MMQIIQIIQIRNTALTRQHELDHTDHTDHTDQEYICPERANRSLSGNRSYRSVRCIQLVTRLGRGSEATEAVFLLSGKNAPSYRGAHRVPLFNLSVLSVCVCLCVSVSVCVTFVVFTDCESCTRPISTNSESMQAGE